MRIRKALGGVSLWRCSCFSLYGNSENTAFPVGKWITEVFRNVYFPIRVRYYRYALLKRSFAGGWNLVGLCLFNPASKAYIISKHYFKAFSAIFWRFWGLVWNVQKSWVWEEIKRYKKRGCVKMMHPLFRYIIIVLPFFIEYDLCFSYVHAFWWYNVL